AQETTLFKSVGLAIQDLAAAAAILQAAEVEDVGTVVEI
ncbi:MAG: ornithine cyclodeaminase family protein, partial [Gammaproteobacteria bacterium]